MRIATTFLLIGLSGVVHAQDWALFPLGQRSYYMEGTGPGDHGIRMECMDSIRTGSSGSTLLFRTKLPVRNSAECRDEFISSPWLYVPYDPFRLDSLLQRNDSILFSLPGVAQPLLLLPHAAVGDTWTGHPSISQLTCTAIAEEPVLGVLDSVKTFVITLSGGSWGDVPVQRSMRLSRTYGLLDFVPFQLLIPHQDGLSQSSYHLSRVEGPFGDPGPSAPGFEQFFHLGSGDVLFWEEHQEALWATEIPWTRYHLDSITSAFISEDSVRYDLLRTSLWDDGQLHGPSATHRSFPRSLFAPLVECEPQWWTMVPSGMEPETALGIWFADRGLEVTGGADTIHQVQVSTNLSTFDTTACEYIEGFDWGAVLQFDTRMGLIRDCSSFSSASHCMTLIGSIIHGEQEGQVIHLGVEGNIHVDKGLNIHPSPAHDRIQVEGNVKGIRTPYRILDRTGRLFQQGVLMPDGIDVSGLPSGLYLLQLDAMGGTISGRFVKE